MGGHNFYPFYTTLYVISLFLYQVSQGISRYLKVSQRKTSPKVDQDIQRYPKVYQRYIKVNPKVSKGISKGIQRYIKGLSMVYPKVSKGIQRYIKVSQGISRYHKVSQGSQRKTSPKVDQRTDHGKTFIGCKCLAHMCMYIYIYIHI